MNATSQPAIKKLLQDIKQNGLVVYAGAGISVPDPCLCPTWPGLRFEILDRLLGKLCKEDWPKKPYLEEIKKIVPEINIRPEILMWTLASDIGFIEAVEMIKGLDTSIPNINHLAMAALAKAGILKAIVTSNFDTYLEKAFDAMSEPIEYTVIRDEKEAEEWLRGAREGVLIFKPHGCITKHWSMKYRMDQIQTLSHYKAELLSRALGTAPVLVLGYSGNDEDIFPTFSKSLISNKKGVYVCVHPTSSKEDPIRNWNVNFHWHIHKFIAKSEDVMDSLVSSTGLQEDIRYLTSRFKLTPGNGKTNWKEMISKRVEGIPHDVITMAIAHLFLILRDFHKAYSFADLARDIVEDTDLSLSSYESMMFIRELHAKASHELDRDPYGMGQESRLWEALERDGEPVEKLAGSLIDEALKMLRNNDLELAEKDLTLAGTYLFKKRIQKGTSQPDSDFTTWLWYSGILCRKQSKYKEADRFFDRAINIAYDQGDNINCGRMLLDYGLLRRDIFDMDGARQLFAKAKELAFETGDRETLGKANTADANTAIMARINQSPNR